MGDTVRISRIRFRAGARPGSPPLETDVGTVLLLVGPNNVGKSLALQEIEQICTSVERARKVVDALEFDIPDNPEVATRLAERFEIPPPPDNPEMLHVARRSPQGVIGSFQATPDAIRVGVLSRDLGLFLPLLIGPYTIRLDSRTRFALVNPQPSGDLISGTTWNLLIDLLKDNDARARVRTLTAEAFNLHFVIDPTGMQNLKIRMSVTAPTSTGEEIGLDTPSRNFHAQAREITEFSDAVQSFVSLVCAVLSLPHTILLVEDPEAFLHPPLVRRLGRNLAMIAHERRATLAAATHSPDFVIACLEAVADTTIVRLTYQGGVATARCLAPAELRTMARDPLLRSTNVLRAIFHKAAIVTEADTDRAFYDEMNQRLLAAGRGAEDAVFLNAQNMQTERRLVDPLRKIGIPTAAIVDLDIIENGGARWERLLDSCRIPAARRVPLETERAYLASVFAAISYPAGTTRPIKSRGLSALSAAQRGRADALLGELSVYGLFLVPAGEVECWLRHLGVTDKGPDWLMQVFSSVGQSETDPHYVRPGPDDVWDFLDEIAHWFNDPDRLGID